jgi:hypothetical protein
MSGNAAFAVPKDRQEVTVLLDRGETLTGQIFLEYMASDLSIHQKITMFLENDNAFFPIKVGASGGAEFVNKNNIWTVDVVIPSDPKTDFFSHLLMHTIPIIAHFADGTTISGELMAEVPKEKARLSDCLNMSNVFISVKTNGTMRYINKQSLQKVIHADKK